MIRFRIHIFVRKHHRNDAMFSLYHTMRYTISGWPIPDRVNFGHLVRMVSTMFLYGKGNKKFMRRFFETVNVLLLIKLSPVSMSLLALLVRINDYYSVVNSCL